MFEWFKEWHQGRIIRRATITEAQWQDAFQQLPLLWRLNAQEKKKLQDLAIVFLYYKTLEAIGNFKISIEMQLIIALQACLPILNLGLDWYKGWVTIILYPGAFVKQSAETDEYGIVHKGSVNLSGESWQRGPVILSWDDASPHGRQEGHNVVIHELAHKLDMLNGKANGFPPLHKDMSALKWSKVFTEAFADFEGHLLKHRYTPIDPYAETSAAEFFAVLSELFFERPLIIRNNYSGVYRLLSEFYRQDPLLSGKSLD